MYSYFPRMSHNIVGAWLVLIGREEMRAEAGHGSASVCLRRIDILTMECVFVCGLSQEPKNRGSCI